MNKIILVSVYLLLSPLPSVFTALASVNYQGSYNIKYPSNFERAFGKYSKTLYQNHEDIAEIINDDKDYDNEITESVQCSDQACTVCKFFVKFLRYPPNVEVLTVIGETFCGLLPNNILSTVCEIIVSVYPMDIAPFLNSHSDLYVCQLINACPRRNGIVDASEIYQDYCPICVSFLQKLKERISKDKMNHIIAVVCNELPKTNRKRCTFLLNLFGQIFFNQILAKMSPQKMCTTLNFCKSKTEEPKQSVIVDTFYDN